MTKQQAPARGKTPQTAHSKDTAPVMITLPRTPRTLALARLLAQIAVEAAASGKVA